MCVRTVHKRAIARPLYIEIQFFNWSCLSCVRASWMGSFGMGWQALGHSFQKISFPNWCFYHYNCLGTSWMGWGQIEWVGVSGGDMTRPKWPKNYISLSSTLSFGNSKWLIFVRYVFLLQVPNFNRMTWPATSSPWKKKMNQQIFVVHGKQYLASKHQGVCWDVKAVLPLGLNPLKSLHRISFEADLPHQQTPSLWRALLQTEEFWFSSLPLCTSPLQTSQPPPGLPFQSHQLSRSGQKRDCSIPHPCSWSVVSGHLEGWYYCSKTCLLLSTFPSLPELFSSDKSLWVVSEWYPGLFFWSARLGEGSITLHV